jgi:hypothetical protein
MSMLRAQLISDGDAPSDTPAAAATLYGQRDDGAPTVDVLHADATNEDDDGDGDFDVDFFVDSTAPRGEEKLTG